MLEVIYGVLLWADMNAATPLGTLGRFEPVWYGIETPPWTAASKPQVSRKPQRAELN